MTTPEAALRGRMADFGLRPPDIHFDGKLHRFKTEGDRGPHRSGAGWYRAFTDGQGAVFGCHRTGVDESWQFNGTSDEAVSAETRRIWQERRQAHEEQRRKAHEAAAQKAQKLWTEAGPASADHPYLVKKGIGPEGLHQSGTKLLVPMKNAARRLVSLQTINADGVKRFLTDGQIKGTRATVGGKGQKDVIYVAEGWATAATIHAVTGAPVAVAFFADNLTAVTEDMVARYPDATIIIAADNDYWSATPKGRNPGVSAARAAAEATGALVAVPSFKECCRNPDCARDCGKEHPTDFNDLARLEGEDAVRRWLDPAAVEDEPPAELPEAPTLELSEPEAATEPWPEPRLPGPPEPERLPAKVLPPALAAHAESVAQALQVPHELPELLALACVSTAVAGRVEVEPRPGWREPVGVYTATILPPASRKSPVYALMTAPVRDWEAENMKAVAPCYLAALDVVDVARAALEGTKRAAARGKAIQEEVEAARVRLSDAEAEVPLDGRLLAGDVTPEALVLRLAAQGGRLAVLEPEPGPLQMVAGRYSDRARLNEFTKSWSAEDLTVDRIGRPPLHVRRPALTLAVLLQPGVLEGLEHGRALRAEGLIGRVLWCRPPHGLGTRLTGADVPALDEAAAAEYDRVIRALLDLKPAGAEPDGTSIPHVLRLDGEALAVLHEFEGQVETQLADGGRYAEVRDWAGKMVGQALRIAALLELAARAGDGRPLVADISPWAMAGAVRLVRALATHAGAVLHGLDEPPRTAALRYLIRRLQELPQGTTETGLRDSARRHRYIESAADLAALLDELERRGCVRRVPLPRRSGPGRPPSPLLALHPKLVCQPPGKHPRNPDKPLPEVFDDALRDKRDTIRGSDIETHTPPDPWAGSELEPTPEDPADPTQVLWGAP